jgi:erythromycin esterase-like protein
MAGFRQANLGLLLNKRFANELAAAGLSAKKGAYRPREDLACAASLPTRP